MSIENLENPQREQARQEYRAKISSFIARTALPKPPEYAPQPDIGLDDEVVS